MFNTAKDQYQEALIESGYEHELMFDPTSGQSPLRKKEIDRKISLGLILYIMSVSKQNLLVIFF